MKRLILISLILSTVMLFIGCASTSNDDEQLNNISDCLVTEYGRQYLILPASKAKVQVSGYEKHLNNINIELLKNAEENANNQASEPPYFYLYEDQMGYLCLGAEWIVYITPDETGMSGCDIDHKHMYSGERIVGGSQQGSQTESASAN